MAVLSIARVLVDKTDIAAQSHLKSAQLYYPKDYLHATNSSSAQSTLYSNLQPFMNFSGLPSNTTDPVYNFFPEGCVKGDFDDARTIIAFSGNSNLTDSVVRDI